MLTNFNASLPCTLNSNQFYLISKFLIKEPISNNGPLKHSASDFTQLQPGIVTDLECCWVTVQSAFLSIKCLRASDMAHKRGNRSEWDCFNSITLKGRIGAGILFIEAMRERKRPPSHQNLCCNLDSFILSGYAAVRMSHVTPWPGALSHERVWLENRGSHASEG